MKLEIWCYQFESRTKEKHEQFQDHVLSVYYFCAFIRGKNGGAFANGLHNELRKENNAVSVSCIFKVLFATPCQMDDESKL